MAVGVSPKKRKSEKDAVDSIAASVRELSASAAALDDGSPRFLRRCGALRRKAQGHLSCIREAWGWRAAKPDAPLSIEVSALRRLEEKKLRALTNAVGSAYGMLEEKRALYAWRAGALLLEEDLAQSPFKAFAPPFAEVLRVTVNGRQMVIAPASIYRALRRGASLLAPSKSRKFPGEHRITNPSLYALLTTQVMQGSLNAFQVQAAIRAAQRLTVDQRERVIAQLLVLERPKEYRSRAASLI